MTIDLHGGMNRRHVQELLTEILDPIAVHSHRMHLELHLRRQPAGQHRVFEILNALAAAAALTIIATGRAQEAERFFHQAVTDNIQCNADG